MDIISKTLTINNQEVIIHGISTGQVAVKNKFRTARRKGLIAMIDFMLDKTFTEWMPIYTWVIQHPEGTFLIDTGENSRVNDPDYFKPSGRFAQWFNTNQFKFQVKREDEIDVQLSQIGLKTADIDQVILTHLHLDHIDGLHHFTDNQVLVNRKEWEKPFGDLPKLYPTGFQPRLVDLEEQYENLGACHFLTQSKDLTMISTPGHTHGHTSILLHTDQGLVLFAGDLVYFEGQLRDNTFSGGIVNQKLASLSYQKIRSFAQSHKLIILPSHDIEAANRLAEMKPFQI